MSGRRWKVQELRGDALLEVATTVVERKIAGETEFASEQSLGNGGYKSL